MGGRKSLQEDRYPVNSGMMAALIVSLLILPQGTIHFPAMRQYPHKPVLACTCDHPLSLLQIALVLYCSKMILSIRKYPVSGAVNLPMLL